MIEFVAYLSAQQQTEDLARSALPNAPVQPDADRAQPEPRYALPRQRISLLLRRLADRIEPAPARVEAAGAGC